MGQLERFHLKIVNGLDLSKLIEKINNKYDSDSYRDRWYKRSIEPPEDLLWFIYYYAQKYCSPVNNEEFEKYSSLFTTQIYSLGDHLVHRIDGQGSIIKIEKKC